jgi:hypothetical protein
MLESKNKVSVGTTSNKRTWKEVLIGLLGIASLFLSYSISGLLADIYHDGSFEGNGFAVMGVMLLYFPASLILMVAMFWLSGKDKNKFVELLAVAPAILVLFAILILLIIRPAACFMGGPASHFLSIRHCGY